MPSGYKDDLTVYKKQMAYVFDKSGNFLDVLRDAPLLAGFKETISSDRKSTRLNSSHPSISYAVFCLKKKKKKIINTILHKHLMPMIQNQPPHHYNPHQACIVLSHQLLSVVGFSSAICLRLYTLIVLR